MLQYTTDKLWQPDATRTHVAPNMRGSTQKCMPPRRAHLTINECTIRFPHLSSVRLLKSFAQTIRHQIRRQQSLAAQVALGHCARSGWHQSHQSKNERTYAQVCMAGEQYSTDSSTGLDLTKRRCVGRVINAVSERVHICAPNITRCFNLIILKR